MGYVDDMKKLKDRFITDFNVRIGGITALKSQTQGMLKDFQKENKQRAKEVRDVLTKFVGTNIKMTSDLMKNIGMEHKVMTTTVQDYLSNVRSDLAKGEAKRARETKKEQKDVFTALHEGISADEAKRVGETRKMIKGIQGEIKELFKDTGNLLKDFHTSHTAMAEELRIILGKVQSALGKEEAQRVKETHAEISARMDEVRNLLDNVPVLLESFDKAHTAMSKELRSMLVGVRPDLSEAEAKRLKGDQAGIKDRISYLNRFMKDFHKSYDEMTTTLREMLGKFVNALEKGEADRVKETMAEIKERVDGLKKYFASVNKQMAEFRKEHEEAAKAWADLTRAMAGARRQPGVKEVPGAKEVKPKPKPKAKAKTTGKRKKKGKKKKEEVV